MKAKEIAFTCYPITNVVRSRRFYEKTLGLKPSHVFKGHGVVWIEYDIGHGTLALAHGKVFPKPTAKGVHLAIEVADFPQAIRHLKRKKVKFLWPVMETSCCSMAGIADPDGSQIIIHKLKK